MKRWMLAIVVAVAACSQSPTSALNPDRLRDVGSATTDGGLNDTGWAPRDTGVAARDTGVQALDAGSVTCTSLSEQQCANANGCAPHYCAGCDDQMYMGCTEVGQAVPGCPPIWCPECRDFGSAAECGAVDNCWWHDCPGCNGERLGGACLDDTAVPPPCPGIACPPCDLFDETQCIRNSGCHAVYTEVNPACLCDAPGCCNTFERCAEGGQADCTSGATCRRREPICEGPYTVAYENSCYEGCVRAVDCAP